MGAREVYGLLVHIVAEYKITLARPEEHADGLIVGGWSFGTTPMTAFLGFMASFPHGDVDLRKYLRRVVFLGVHPFDRLCRVFTLTRSSAVTYS